MKPKSVLDLIPLIGDEQAFRKAISEYEVVMPKPWRHRLFPGAEVCIKCKKTVWDGEKYTPEMDNPCPIPDTFTGSLGDLAFELRDKACKLPLDEQGISLFDRAKIEVWKTCCVFAGNAAVKHQAFFSQMLIAADSWFNDRAKPKHWIIAVLYALGLAKEGKGKNDT
jgi:hypothetical protein